METFHLGDSGMETVSDRVQWFDFLSKQSVSDEVTDQSFNNDRSAEDGFLTPTSTDQKIKKIKICPPAPRKPPPPPPSSRKRKALFPVDQSAVVADLAKEIAKLSPQKKARVLTAPATVM